MADARPEPEQAAPHDEKPAPLLADELPSSPEKDPPKPPWPVLLIGTVLDASFGDFQGTIATVIAGILVGFLASIAFRREAPGLAAGILLVIVAIVLANFVNERIARSASPRSPPDEGSPFATSRPIIQGLLGSTFATLTFLIGVVGSLVALATLSAVALVIFLAMLCSAM